jgi:hypothetical protein
MMPIAPAPAPFSPPPRPFAQPPAPFAPAQPTPPPAPYTPASYLPLAQPVFISHAGEDDSVAADVCRLLELDGVRCWLAPRDIHPRRPSGAQTIDAIESASAMVLVLSTSANASVFVANEVERAVSKGKTVIVLRVEPVRPSPALELFVSRSQWIDAWTPPLEEPVQVLGSAIRNLLGMPARPVKALRAESGSGSRRLVVSGRSLGVGIAAVATVALVAGLLFFASRGPAPVASRSPVAAASATTLASHSPSVTRSISPIVSTTPQSTGRLPVFSATGSMAEARVFHSETMLGNGRVLIAGGLGNSGMLATAELFDPGTGKFSPTGSMIQARAAHTATLLPDGRVLVVAGVSATGDLASAELYDPGTGKFSQTAPLPEGRKHFTATLLRSGRVLIAGGWDDKSGKDVGVAQLYDPAIGKFTPTGTMITARDGHTATLLPDGRVLIAGGWDDTAVLTSAELYDPTTGKFSQTSPMTESRAAHTATLLPDGRVLVAAGDYDTHGASRSSAELYDPTTGKFTPTGSMVQARTNHTATLLSDGRVLIVGGYDEKSVFASGEMCQP